MQRLAIVEFWPQVSHMTLLEKEVKQFVLHPVPSPSLISPVRFTFFKVSYRRLAMFSYGAFSEESQVRSRKFNPGRCRSHSQTYGIFREKFEVEKTVTGSSGLEA